jgi:Tfp pilus assembly protein PilX
MFEALTSGYICHYQEGVNMKKQQGSFILFTLIIISLIAGVSHIGMLGAIQSSRLTQSYLSYTLAINNAELALIEAQESIDINKVYKVSQINKPIENGLYPSLLRHQLVHLSAWEYIDEQDLWLNPDYCFTKHNAHSAMSKRYLNAYIIEKLALPIKSVGNQLFRITAVGFGLQRSARVILQTMVVVGENKKRISWLKITT